MALLTRTDIKSLVENVEGPCVSIYMPAHPVAEIEKKQDQIRLRNLLRDARDRLLALGLKSREADLILQPAGPLLTDDDFWRHQRECLAIFASRNSYRHYRLPLSVNELLTVSDRFHVRPLLTLLTGDGSFYVLAISQKDLRLLLCTRYTACEIDLEDVPKAVVHLMEYDERERYKFVGYHPAAAPAVGRWAAAFHGQTMGMEHTKKEVLEHFQRVDRGINKMLAGERTPLVLAAVDYLHPIYREANTYPHLLEQGIQGNPEGVSCGELHRLGWAVAEPYFARKYREAVSRYEKTRGSARASGEIKDIVAAAYYGRVYSLFVALSQQCWGAFNPDTGEVKFSPDGQQPGAADLLDFAAAHTLINDGDVYVVKPEDVPENKVMAAVFRY
ncbi:MAG: hypothetical protein HY673_21915 [Chloroflexi bacterium]|nr:hypothetical protein [Chloroflexota bacterium]